MHRNLVILSGILLTALHTASLAHADTIYAVTNDDHLLQINTATPAATSKIASLDSAAASLGLFFNGNSLYVYDTDNNLVRQVNELTGATIATINIGLAASPGEGDVVFRNGTGYLASTYAPDGSFTGSGSLFKFTLNANSAQLVSSSGAQLDGLAFSSTGVLYGLSQGGATLYTINTVTGAESEVGATGITGAFGFGGLAFGSGGTLFASLSDFSDPAQLYSINTQTAHAADLGALGFPQISGLAAMPVQVPEPSTFACLLLGLALLLRLFATPHLLNIRFRSR